MYTEENIDKFAELRAQGWSLGHIYLRLLNTFCNMTNAPLKLEDHCLSPESCQDPAPEKTWKSSHTWAQMARPPNLRSLHRHERGHDRMRGTRCDEIHLFCRSGEGRSSFFEVPFRQPAAANAAGNHSLPPTR